MSAVMNKLGYKEQSPILIINDPQEFSAIKETIPTSVDDAIKGDYSFILAFADSIAVAQNFAKDIAHALEGDGHLWLAYPKGSSKKYKSDLNRSTAWDLFGAFGFEPVSQVAIDEDWSAIRYRQVDNIKVMKRKKAATKKGKERVKKK